MTLLNSLKLLLLNFSPWNFYLKKEIKKRRKKICLWANVVVVVVVVVVVGRFFNLNQALCLINTSTKMYWSKSNRAVNNLKESKLPSYFCPELYVLFIQLHKFQSLMNLLKGWWYHN